MLLLAAGATRAADYMAPFDQATWQVAQSALSCRLHQEVPKYGDVVFETPAGKPQIFYVAVERNPMRSGVGQWIAAAPSWNPDRPEQPLGGVVVGEGRQPILLDDGQAQRLLQALRDGLVPELVQPGVDAAPEPVRLGLSPVNFQSAYERYLRCTGQLLPRSFEEMANSSIEFGRDRSDLEAAARRKIDLVLRYVVAERRAAGRAPRIDIDVLSDDSYRRVENLELSKLRAQTVNDYLVSRGIDPASITTRHRSMRGGSDLSRRSVTIRLRRTTKAGDAPAVADAG